MKELLLINTIIISICTRVDVMRHVKSTSRGFLYARPTVIAYVGCGNSGNSSNSEDGVVLAPSPAPLFTFKLKVDFEVSVHKASLPPRALLTMPSWLGVQKIKEKKNDFVYETRPPPGEL